MTPDVLICKIAGLLLLALFLALARLLTVTRRAVEPKRAFVYATARDGGDPIRGDNGVGDDRL